MAEGGASPASAGFGEHAGETRGQDPDINKLGSQIIREIVIPELTKEVNEDKNFAQLRQVYNSPNPSHMVQKENQRQHFGAGVCG